MRILKILRIVLDFIVPFGEFLRSIESKKTFRAVIEVLIRLIPQTFFIYWLFSMIPILGTFVYILIFIPLSAFAHIKIKRIINTTEKVKILLWYFVVILLGFGGIWSFVGHFFMADMVATMIGWPTGSPFQIELAFYTLGTALSALAAIWFKGHMITALIISKSVFWYGAAYVHIKDIFERDNYSPYNIGLNLIGDILFPTIFLFLLVYVLRNDVDFMIKTKLN